MRGVTVKQLQYYRATHIVHISARLDFLIHKIILLTGKVNKHDKHFIVVKH